MTITIHDRARRLAGAALAGAVGLAGGALPTHALAEPSENLTVNLMRLLVKQGVITQDAAAQLMAQAQRETAEARVAGAGDAPVEHRLPPVAPGSTRIPYVPEIVKNQIRDEVRREVIEQAKAENWAQPNALPEWVKHVQISGDVRVRDAFNLYSSGNQNDLINYAAINANGPVDINPATNKTGVPILNTTKDRDNLLEIRARLEVRADPSPWVTAAVRLASGQTNSPVSTSQLLGGGLSKKSIWLDRAYIDLHPRPWIGATLGRMPNPFMSTDLVFDEDLNFDGVAARGAMDAPFMQGLRLSAVGGVFVTDYQDLNFPSTGANGADKANERTKWMVAIQGAADWRTDRFDWKTSAALYQYQSSRGLLSSPCAVYAGVTQCSTDATRPAFMQKGNTLFLIRNIIPDPGLPIGAAAAPQFAGLLFDYNVLNLNTAFDLKVSDKHLVLVGDYARNLAYKHSDSCRFGSAGLPVTNVIAPNLADTNICAPGTTSRFKSGPNAWMLKASYGDPDAYAFGRWNVTAGYKHIAPDSMPDAYNDSDFHLGGTNAEGYFLTGTLGLMAGANLQARWFSANELFGPPLSIDVGQIELNVRF